MAFYPRNKLSLLLNPLEGSTKEKSASSIFTGLFFSHLVIICILYIGSIIPLYILAGLAVNYFALSYAAASASLGYSDHEHATQAPNDKTTMSQLTTLFFITGVWPLIAAQVFAPALFVLNIFILFYSIVALATYLHFDDSPTHHGQSLLSDLRGFFKSKIFSKPLSLISMNKHLSAKEERRLPREEIDQITPRGPEDFGSGRLDGTSVPMPIASAPLYDSRNDEGYELVRNNNKKDN